jgi:hypothetical protein
MTRLSTNALIVAQKIEYPSYHRVNHYNKDDCDENVR